MTTSDKHTEALRILEPMISVGLESYMFEPEVGGLLINGNKCELILDVYTYKHNSYPTLKIGTHPKSWFWGNYETREIYLPTFEQALDEILKFNDERVGYKIKHSLINKCFAISINQNKDNLESDIIWINIKEFTYTDTDSMYLSLLKICVHIWQINQESK